MKKAALAILVAFGIFVPITILTIVSAIFSKNEMMTLYAVIFSAISAFFILSFATYGIYHFYQTYVDSYTVYKEVETLDLGITLSEIEEFDQSIQLYNKKLEHNKEKQLKEIKALYYEKFYQANHNSLTQAQNKPMEGDPPTATVKKRVRAFRYKK